jgi:hypothetical protein
MTAEDADTGRSRHTDTAPARRSTRIEQENDLLKSRGRRADLPHPRILARSHARVHIGATLYHNLTALQKSRELVSGGASSYRKHLLSAHLSQYERGLLCALYIQTR